MKIVDQINKTKEESNLIQNLGVDVAYIQKLAPSLGTYDGKITEQAKDVFIGLNTACDSIKTAVETIKSRIPTYE